MPAAQGWQFSRCTLGKYLSLLFVLLVAAGPVRGDVQYIYDGAGRLVQVVAADGSSAIYEYDAAGNILNIQRITSGQLTLTTFSPTAGAAGTQVTIHGSGFAATPGGNTVTFNGSAATVLAASANQLSVQVPSGATTGPISVTVGANTVNSARNFVVQAGPTITGFSPAIINSGATVTVTGTNLNPLSQSTRASVGITGVLITSLSATQLSFLASRGSGLIRVTTPFGEATSATPLIVVPASISPANVVATAVLVGGGAAQTLNVGQTNKHGVLAFEATQGQYLSVQLTSFAPVPSNASISYQVISPANAVIASGSVSASSPSIHLPKAPESGTYLVAFASGSNTFQLSAKAEVNAVLSAGAPTLSVTTTVAAQSTRFIIPATAGDNIGIGVANLALTPGNGSVGFTVYKPDGGSMGALGCWTPAPVAGCGKWLMNVPQTGDYQIRTEPGAQTTLSFNLSVTQPVAATLSSGVPLNVSLPVRGQWALLSFTATAGQDASLWVDSIATTPANEPVEVRVYNPSGTEVANSNSTGSRTHNLWNLAAGTYKVVVATANGVPATATVRATVGNAVSSTVPTDGSSTHFQTTVPGQRAQLKFNGTAGQNIGIGVSSLALTPSGSVGFTVFKPDGGSMGPLGCWTPAPISGCGKWLMNLPQTGEYRVQAEPAERMTLGFDFWVSQAVTATLTSGVPQNVSLPIRGQWALLSFTATAGQDASLWVDSIATTPANEPVEVRVYNPSGGEVANSNSTGSRTHNLSNLAAGTYKVVVATANGVPATATVRVTVGNAVSSTVPTDGSSTHFDTTVPGQKAQLKFNGIAGQNIGIGISNLALTPSGSVGFTVFRPDGGSMGALGCWTPAPISGCGKWLMNLPQTGEYRVQAEPAERMTLSFDFWVSQAVTATLTSGVPQNLSLPIRGQWALLSFTATAGQDASLWVDSIATTPANEPVEVRVYNPSGTEIANSNSTGSRTHNLWNLAAGTYKVAVATANGVPATATVRVTVGAAVSGTVPTDGSSTHFDTTVPGQRAQLRFNGTAGQNIGIGISNLGLTPSGSVGFTVFRPDGGSMGAMGCWTPAPISGCGKWLMNLPQTGEYRVQAEPAERMTLSFDFWVSQAVTATLTSGVPQNVSLPIRGQWALLSFTATAGQSVSITVNSIVTTPANEPVETRVYNPSGTEVANSNTTGSRTHNLTNLAAGTYKIAVITANGVPASAQVTLN